MPPTTRTTGGNTMRLRIGLAVAATAAPLALTCAPADAATLIRSSPLMSCSISGGGAALQAHASWRGADEVAFLPAYLTDTKRDGYAPEMRVVTQDAHGERHHWSWVKNSQGAGHTKTVNSTVKTSQGITFAWIELRNGPHTCRTSPTFNPLSGARPF